MYKCIINLTYNWTVSLTVHIVYTPYDGLCVLKSRIFVYIHNRGHPKSVYSSKW